MTRASRDLPRLVHYSGISIPEHELEPWGLAGIPPDAKLPSSQVLLMNLQRFGYLTATTEWYVTGLTLELDGNMSPHVWMLLTPAVWELSTA